jgi:predicted Zn-dependent protease
MVSVSDTPDRARELARHYLGVAQPERALDAIAQARPGELEDPELWALRGWALVDLDRHEEAVGVASDALGRWPGDVDFLRLLAVAQAQRDHLAEAEAAVLAGLQGEADDTHLLCTYADALTRGGQLRKARAVLEVAAHSDPDDVLVTRMRLNLAFVEGRDGEARELAEDLLGRDSDDYQGQVMLGGLDMAKARLRSAERRFGSAIRTDPSSPGIARAARSARTMRSPLYWPMLPFERFGPGPTWVAAVVLIAGLSALGLELASGIAALVWIVLVVYSWVAAPIVRRRMKGGDW